MSISQELDSADADRLNDQLRLTLEFNELPQLADDDYEGILGLGDNEEDDEACLREAELALDNELYHFWGLL